MASILTGTILSVVLIVLSPTVWVDVLGNPRAVITLLKNPAVISMTLSFVAGGLVSLLRPERTSQNKFEEETLRTYLGIGAE